MFCESNIVQQAGNLIRCLPEPGRIDQDIAQKNITLCKDCPNNKQLFVFCFGNKLVKLRLVPDTILKGDRL